MVSKMEDGLELGLGYIFGWFQERIVCQATQRMFTEYRFLDLRQDPRERSFIVRGYGYDLPNVQTCIRKNVETDEFYTKFDHEGE